MDSQLSSFVSISGRNSGGIYKLTLNLLNLDNSDFPDVCMHCELCMLQVKAAIVSRANAQIKDPDVASEFTSQAMSQLMNFFKFREESCENETRCKTGAASSH